MSKQIEKCEEIDTERVRMDVEFSHFMPIFHEINTLARKINECVSALNSLLPDVEEKKCVCGEQICLGGAEVEIGGVCHRPKNPCYIIPPHTPVVEWKSDFEDWYEEEYKEFWQLTDYIEKLLTSARSEERQRLTHAIEEELNPTTIAEQIVIEYANISGRESENRAFVREAARKVLETILATLKEITKIK